MKKDTLLAFAVDTPYMGCRNQLLGALDAINKNSKTDSRPKNACCCRPAPKPSTICASRSAMRISAATAVFRMKYLRCWMPACRSFLPCPAFS